MLDSTPSHIPALTGGASPPGVSIGFTILTKANGGLLSKRIALDAAGKLVSDGSACVMSAGQACRATASGADATAAMAALAAAVNGLAPSQALALGSLRRGLPDVVDITTSGREDEARGLVSRTGRYLDYAPGALALLLLDFDGKGMPATVGEQIRTAGGVWDALCQVCPALSAAASVERASTSAGIVNKATGQPFVGSGGVHVFVPIKDGTDAKRALAVLHDRLWLAGFGWMRVSDAGAILERSPVDCAVSGPERLVFEGAPEVVPPLAQDAAARKAIAHPGGMLDTRHLLADLTPGERVQLGGMKRAARGAMADEAAQARAVWERDRVAVLVKQGVDPAKARQCVAGATDGLHGDWPLFLDDGRTVTVADVLRDPAGFHRKTCADPLEPGYGGGRNLAVIHSDHPWAVVRSLAHGGQVFPLRWGPEDIIEAAQAAGADPVGVVREMAQTAALDAEGWTHIAEATGVTRTAVLERIFPDEERRRLAEVVASLARSDHGPRLSVEEAAMLAEGRIAGLHQEVRDALAAAEASGLDAQTAAVEVDAAEARLQQQAAQAEAANVPAHVARITNEGWFVIEVGKAVPIGRRDPDGELKLMQRRDFLLLHENQRVVVTRNGKPAATNAGEDWLRHPSRPTYRGMGLYPPGVACPAGALNLWPGWGVTAKGDWRDCRRILQHIRRVICAGDRASRAWFLRWMAWGVQHPDLKPEVAVTMIGGQGCGKGAVGTILRRIYGQTALYISRKDHLVGRFNGHLADKMFVFADEALFARDPSIIGPVKALVTEPAMTIERKFVDAVEVPNRFRLLMASNEDHAVHLDTDDRRFAVFRAADIWGREDARDQRARDAARARHQGYFNALWAEINGGGVAAFLDLLLRIDLAGWDMRALPDTGARAEQKLQSLTGVAKWWAGMLAKDNQSYDKPIWGKPVPKAEIYGSYESWVQRQKDERHTVHQVQFWKRLRTMVALPEVRPRQGPQRPGVRSVILPTQDDARAQMDAFLSAEGAMDWGDE